MKGFYTLVFLLFICCSHGQHGNNVRAANALETKKPINGIRIAWDHSTLKQLSPAEARYSGYARMIKLHDGILYCVYESDKAVLAIKSADGGGHWSRPVVVASPENNIACAVPEVLQLQDGSLLVSYNLRPPANNTDRGKRFSIQVRRSSNGGTTWSQPVEVYKAGHEFKNGCWEPAQIQLPSGEIQLFIANEGPYTQTEEQEITLFRSADNGFTWTGGETVSFREGYRDGMPVPLLLKNQREIILAIEDNGVHGEEFKPMIIRTSANDNWNNIPVSGSSMKREYAMDQLAAIPGKKYAGAPYIRQLTSAEVVLSYQGNELRKDFQWDRSDMIVAIGSQNGKNFNRKSTPFYIADPSKTALWNSLCVENDSTVIALSSTNAYGKMAVWMIKGRVLQEIRSGRQSITIDGKTDERLWKTKAPVFIGGFGRTNASINCAWNADKIFFTAVIQDEKVVSSAEDEYANDALQFFLDPQNQSTELPDENIFCLTVTASGKYIFKEGKRGSWTGKNATGIEATSVAIDSGYHIEVAIPWTALNTVPKTNQRMGFHAALIETSNGRQHSYVEPLAGNISEAPYTWSPLFLTESL